MGRYGRAWFPDNGESGNRYAQSVEADLGSVSFESVSNESTARSPSWADYPRVRSTAHRWRMVKQHDGMRIMPTVIRTLVWYDLAPFTTLAVTRASVLDGRQTES